MKDKEQSSKGFAWTLWIPVILAFVVVSLGWYVRIQISRENPIEVIPLEESSTQKKPKTESAPGE